MTASPRRRRAIRDVRASLELGLGTLPRPGLLVIAWRWRYELLFPAGMAVTWLALGIAGGAVVTAGLAVAVVAMAVTPQGRRWLAARFWLVVTPHRVRAGCVQAWIHSRDGKIPAVLLTRSMPFGERVYLWCRAGTVAGDLWSARELLAAACWATDVLVFRHPHYAHLVVLDVIRRGGGSANRWNEPPGWPAGSADEHGLPAGLTRK
jgi:hypothetical protein